MNYTYLIDADLVETGIKIRILPEKKKNYKWVLNADIHIKY